MPTADQLVQTIIADPANDQLRLMAADALEDAGDLARSEFIRVQIALESFRGAAGDIFCLDGNALLGSLWNCTAWGEWRKRCRCQVCSLKRREYHSSKRHIAIEWHRGLPLGIYYEFRRGFPARVGCTADEWVKHGPAICRAHPIESVNFQPPHVTTIGRSGSMTWHIEHWHAFPWDEPPAWRGSVEATLAAHHANALAWAKEQARG